MKQVTRHKLMMFTVEFLLAVVAGAVALAVVLISGCKTELVTPEPFETGEPTTPPMGCYEGRRLRDADC